MIGGHNLLIAAATLSFGDTFTTPNFDEFGRPPGLVMVEKSVLRSFQAA